MTADSSSATVTPAGDDGGNSPSGRQSLPSPWAQVVRGGIEPDTVSVSPSPAVFSDPVTAVEATATAEVQPEVQPEGSGGGGGSRNAGGVMKSPWSKPSANGVVEGATSPVMGAASWPALSESTRAGVKSLSGSSESSSKPITDGSDGSAVDAQGPVVSQPPQKQVKHTSNSHSNQNHARQRSFKRGGGAGGGSTGYNRPPPPPPMSSVPPPFPFFDVYGNLVPGVPERPQPPFKVTNRSPRPVDHSLNRNPARRNNFSPRPFNNGNGGRRENNGPRSPAARDVHMPHQVGPPLPPFYRGFIRPPFFFPQPFRPYGVPMGYEMGASYVYYPTLAQPPYRGVTPAPSDGAPASSLHDEILKQIEYYFSDDNLAKDNYLRSHMDEEGWVPIKLIADFRRVQALTNDIQMLLSSLRDSSIVEIQDDRVRRRGDWRRWIHTRREATESYVEEASLQKLMLEDRPTNEIQVLANGDVSIEDACS